MSLSEKAVSNDIAVVRSQRVPSGRVAVPLVLVCIALVLIILSAIFSPATLDMAGAESFLVGP